MKYQVTYRLMHAEYMPATSMTVVEACSHAELETRLGKIVAKWQARGYNVRIIRVSRIRVEGTAFYGEKKGCEQYEQGDAKKNV